MMNEKKRDEIQRSLRKKYAEVAKGTAGCDCSRQTCCPPQDASARLGYSKEELANAPEGANLGLGCGNPQAIASLVPGETVIDLGAGGGFDCFLAARQVGPEGKVIGVDMTAEMVSKARENATKGDYGNVDFRLGEIEHLPVADGTADVVMSNCVINLSLDKAAVYRETFRALKPGGRLAIADVVATAPLPERIKNDIALLSSCVSGAMLVAQLERTLANAGFEKISVKVQEESRELIRQWSPKGQLEDYVASALIEAVKPRR